jgi:hypothetical protein
MNCPGESGDKSPHSIKIPPACYGVRRLVAAFDGGIYSAARVDGFHGGVAVFLTGGIFNLSPNFGPFEK